MYFICDALTIRLLTTSNKRAVRNFTRPHESTVRSSAEPVDHENLGQLQAGLASEGQPVGQVVAKVVAEEGSHGEGVVHHLLGAVLSCSGGLRLDARAHEDAVVPVEALVDQRNTLRSAAAEQDGVDLDTLWIFPRLVEDGAVLSWGTEPGNRTHTNHALISQFPTEMKT